MNTPLYSLEAEQATLGAILAAPEKLDQVKNAISPGDFYFSKNSQIFSAILDMAVAGKQVDLVTVALTLRDRGQLDGVGGAGFLSDLYDAVGLAGNAPYYAQLVKNSSINRQFHILGKRLATACISGNGEVAGIIEEIKNLSVRKSRLDSTLPILEVDEFLAQDFPEKRVILRPWLNEFSLVLIYGPRGVGKSMFSLSLLAAIVSGKSFGPWKVENPVNCLYLDGEMPPQDTAERLKYFSGENNKKLLIYNDAYVTSLGSTGANLLNDDWRKAMKDILLMNNIKLWAADNIASLAPGIDENSKQDWDPINKWFLELRAAGITTIFLHHANKEGGQRGTSGREDNVDISVSLDFPRGYQKEDGARFVCRFEKARLKHSDLHLISDIEFWLQRDDDDRQVWSWNTVKQQTKGRVLKMLDDGLTPNDIAEELRISKSRVSQIKAGCLREGLISENGKITQTGFLWLTKN